MYAVMVHSISEFCAAYCMHVSDYAALTPL